MNRRQFIQVTILTGAFVLWVKNTKVRNLGATDNVTQGLPAGLPFNLAPSPNLGREHNMYIPFVSKPRQTNNGGYVTQVPPNRRTFMKFWERYD